MKAKYHIQVLIDEQSELRRRRLQKALDLSNPKLIQEALLALETSIQALDQTAE